MSETKEGRIVKVAGPVVVAEGMTGARMYDVVGVGELNIIGEIVELHGDLASIRDQYLFDSRDQGHRQTFTSSTFLPGSIRAE